MLALVILTLILFAVVYFFNLRSNVGDLINGKDRVPFFNNLIYGEFNTPLEKPMDATRVGDKIYVSDTGNKRIQVFSLDGDAEFIFGKEGKSEGEFMFPYGITSDSKENIYIADLYNRKISIFNKEGKFQKYFQFTGENPIKLEGPGGLRIFKDKMYITDIEGGKIVVCSLEGKKILEIKYLDGSKLYAPNAITVDKNDNIYVSESGKSRILIYDKKGNFKKIINGSKDGLGDSTLINTRGIAITDNDVLLIADNLSHRIVGYDLNGKELYKFGTFGSESENFVLPNGLSIDKDGNIYITDTGNRRISVYR